MEGRIALHGTLMARHIRGTVPAPLTWKLRNSLRWGFIKGWLAERVVQPVANWSGLVTIIGNLRAVHINGATRKRTDYGVISRHLVTTVFCQLMVDQLIAETSVWGDFKYHDSGVGTTAAAIGDTAIGTTDGESRATGTQVESSAVAYQSVGTIAYTSTKAITEHGLFNDATGTTLNLMDRHVFAAVNVVSGDSIQFTYTLTATAGG